MLYITINNAHSTLSIFQGANNKKMPIRTAYKMAKLITKLESDVNFYRTKFSEILDEYCLRDDNGNYVMVDDGLAYKIQEGREQECQSRISELDNLQIELPDIKFTLDELDYLSLTPEEVREIMVFIEEQ